MSRAGGGSPEWDDLIRELEDGNCVHGESLLLGCYRCDDPESDGGLVDA